MDVHLGISVLPVILSLQVRSEDDAVGLQAVAVNKVGDGRHRVSVAGLARGRIQESQEVGLLLVRLRLRVTRPVQDVVDIAVEETAGSIMSTRTCSADGYLQNGFSYFVLVYCSYTIL